MPRPVTCPHCGEPLDVPAEYRGREVRCAACDRVFTPPSDDLPTASRVGRDWDDAPRRPARDDYDRFDDRWDDRPRRRRKASTAWIWALLAGVLFVCVLPCGGFIALGVVVAFPDFQPYTSPDGKFRADFPGTPTRYTHKLGDGTDRTAVEFKREFADELYFVRHSELSAGDARAGANAALEEACRKALAEKPGSTEVTRSTSTHDGYPAADLTINHPDGGMTIVRLVVAGRRVYAVGITSSDQWIGTDDPRVEHFLNSFKVTATDAVK
jgi:hypothetical protein